MKHKLTHTIGLIAFAILGLASGPAGAVNANGPYYASPSWDQTLPASTRFVALTNMASEAVLDRETGLVWEKVPSTSTSNWLNASIHCVQLSLGGRKGWRLPSIQDLASLIDPTQVNPALPSGHPFTVQSSAYWSATSVADVTSNARYVNFFNGLVFDVGKSSDGNHAWCVRGGQGADDQ